MRRPTGLLFLLPLLVTLGPGVRAPIAAPTVAAAEADAEPTRRLRRRSQDPSAMSGSQRWWHRQRAYPLDRMPQGAYTRGRTAWPTLPRVGGPVTVSPPSAPGFPHAPPPEPPVPSTLPWQFLGPAPVETTFGSLETPNMSPAAGRSSALAIDPSNPDVLYAGYSMGGLWKSIDAGKTWSALSDKLPSLAVGSVIIDPSASQTIYIGTGEAVFYPGYAGAGIYRSTDGGQTWDKFGGDQFDGLSVGRMFLDSATGDFYATAAFGVSGRGNVCSNSGFDAPGQGLHRTSDGGKSWTLLKAGKMNDLEVDTTVTPRRILVSDFATGAFRSIDGGSSWQKPAGLPTLQSTPAARRVELATSASDPSIVYAGLGLGSVSAVFLSTDGGASFAQMGGAPNYCQAQCYYDNSITVHPTDPNIVYVGGSLCGVWKTTDGLSPTPTWTNVSLPGHDCGASVENWYLGYVHPDVHWVQIDPSNPARVYAASDGGIAASTDGGDTWSRLNDGVGTIQFYSACVHPTDPNIVYGGTQDNGIMRRTKDELLWHGLVSGDGGPCAVDTGNPDIVLVSGQAAGVFRTATGFKNSPSYVFSADGSCQPSDPGCGDRAAFIAPLVGDPSTPGTFYVGTHRVWKSAEGGTKASWAPISEDLTAGAGSVPCPNADTFPKFDDSLSAIAVAPSAPGTIYTGSEAGVLSRTTDGGAEWTQVSKAPLPTRYLTSLAIDPLDAKIVYAAFSGFDEATPAAPGHVFRSADGGETWELRDTGINVPVNSLAAHPVARDLVYAGTDFGVLVTLDGGKTWEVLGDSLPRAAVFSLVFQRAATALLAATHGRSAWRLPFGTTPLVAEPPSLSFTVVKGAADPAPAPLGVKADNPYGSIAPFTIASDTPWLSLDRADGVAAGALPSAVSVKAAAAGKAVGEYDGRITITPSSGGAPIEVAVHLTVKAVAKTVKKPKGPSDEGGCGCRAGGSNDAPAWAAIGLVGLGALARRRRRS